MKILTTTIRTIRESDLDEYCSLLAQIGVPPRIIRQLRETGSAEWTSVADTGIVTTRWVWL